MITDDIVVITVFCGTSDRPEIIAWRIYPVGNSGKREGGKMSDPSGISVWALDINLLSYIVSFPGHG